jgi:hypothetical protein
MQNINFNGKYLGGLFRGIRQDGDKKDNKDNPVMCLLIQTEVTKDVLGLEQVSTEIQKVRVPQFLIEKSALNDFADYLDMPVLIPYTERGWSMKGNQGDTISGTTMTLAPTYKTSLSLTIVKPSTVKKEPF